MIFLWKRMIPATSARGHLFLFIVGSSWHNVGVPVSQGPAEQDNCNPFSISAA